MRKTVAAAAMAGALTIGAGAGATIIAPDLVNAQTDDTTESDSTGSDSTESNPGSERPEPGQWLEDTLAPLVDGGTITQEQADAVIAAIQDAKPERTRGPGHRFPIFEDVADVLGLSGDELRDALADGQTLAEVAEANGVEVQAVVDALVETFDGRLDQAVENGRLTEDEADEKRAEATERAEAIVNGDVDLRGPRGHHGPRGGFGPGDDMPDDSGDGSAGSDDETTGS